MDTDILKKILEDNKELLSLPQTLVEVMRVTRDENFSTQQLAAVLMRDPALTAKVLRIVNSPFYGLSRQVSSMNQAVMTLGTRQVTALALSTSVYAVTARWDSRIDRLRFWRHSLEVAIGARMIAEAINYPHWEEVFVSGLLHDIGILILENSYPEDSNRIWKALQSHEVITESEEQSWGTNHARVGQFLLEQWKLPAIICESVGRHHHVFPEGGTNAEMTPAQIVCLSNLISRFSAVRPVPRDVGATIEHKEGLRKNLNLTAEQLNVIESQLLSRTVAEASYLEIEIGRPEEILSEANKIMFEQYLTVENLLRENRKMQNQIAKDQIKNASLESLRTIAVTFNHYINNATAIILGRAQLVEAGIINKQIPDSTGQLQMAMNVIVSAVDTIGMVMDELQHLSSFETTVYHDKTRIIDIEQQVRRRLQAAADAPQSAKA